MSLNNDLDLLPGIGGGGNRTRNPSQLRPGARGRPDVVSAGSAKSTPRPNPSADSDCSNVAAGFRASGPTVNVRPATPEDARYVASHRSTTSSRRPGVAVEGTVMRPLVGLSVCPDCTNRTPRFGDGPHAPRWVVRDGRHVQVDCQGRPVGVMS